MALRQFVVRTAPLTHEAMIVDATSRDNGRLRAWIGNKECEIGMDTYMASGSVELTAAQKIVHAYAKQHNIPDAEVLVRQRLPMNGPKRKGRTTNDANLTLVKDGKQEPKQQEKQPEQDLTAMAQAMQNAHDNQKVEDRKAKQKAHTGEQRATASNPEGAVVETKKRRKYTKQKDAQSKRSQAALRRYQEELNRTQQQSPSIMQPAAPGPGVTPEQYDDAVMELAKAIAKILKSNPGVL